MEDIVYVITNRNSKTEPWALLPPSSTLPANQTFLTHQLTTRQSYDLHFFSLELSSEASSVLISLQISSPHPTTKRASDRTKPLLSHPDPGLQPPLSSEKLHPHQLSINLDKGKSRALLLYLSPPILTLASIILSNSPTSSPGASLVPSSPTSPPPPMVCTSCHLTCHSHSHTPRSL